MRDFLENEIPHIKFKDVSFSYPGEKENLIFKCNFSIKKPGFWMVVGKNGSGKSTLLKLINGIIKPKNGVIWDIGAGCGSIGLEAIRLRPNLDLFCIDKRIGSKALILENSKRLGVKPKSIFEEDINNTLNTGYLSSFEKPNRLVIGGCDKKTKLQIINTMAQGMRIGDIIVIPIIDIQTIKELKEELEDKNFKTSLNLIQTYKSLSIAEGIRLEPNNPVFLLKGKK